MSRHAEQFPIGQPVDLGDLVELPLGVVRAVYYDPHTEEVSYTVLVPEQTLPNGERGKTIADVPHESLTEAVGVDNAYEDENTQEFPVGINVIFDNSIGHARRKIIGLKIPIIAADDAEATAMHGSQAVIISKNIVGDTFGEPIDDSGTLIKYYLWFPSSPDCVIRHFPVRSNEFSVCAAPPLTAVGLDKVAF